MLSRNDEIRVRYVQKHTKNELKKIMKFFGERHEPPAVIKMIDKFLHDQKEIKDLHALVQQLRTERNKLISKIKSAKLLSYLLMGNAGDTMRRAQIIVKSFDKLLKDEKKKSSGTRMKTRRGDRKAGGPRKHKAVPRKK